MKAPQWRLLLYHLQFEACSLVMVGHAFSFSVMWQRPFHRALEGSAAIVCVLNGEC